MKLFKALLVVSVAFVIAFGSLVQFKTLVNHTKVGGGGGNAVLKRSYALPTIVDAPGRGDSLILVTNTESLPAGEATNVDVYVRPFCITSDNDTMWLAARSTGQANCANNATSIVGLAPIFMWAQGIEITDSSDGAGESLKVAHSVIAASAN